MTFLQLQNIEHVYFTEEMYSTALQAINCSIEEGEFVAFVGPSGCGKSTLLSIIAGQLSATKGDVQFEQPDTKIGYMLQQDYLFPWKSIWDNVALGLVIKNNLDAKKVEAILEEVQLAHTAQQYPKQLSGGMRQRIALARTLVTEPSLLLLDEPFSALDYRTRLQLENFVWETLKKHRKTAILVTHDISEAIAMCDRIFLFSKSPGTIIRAFEVPDEIRSATPIQARSIASFQPLFTLFWEELERYE